MADSDRLFELAELKRQINTSVNAQRYWQLLHVFFNGSIGKTEFDAQVKEILGSDDLITVHNKLMLNLIHITLPDVGGGTLDADQQLLEWQQIVRSGGIKSDDNTVINIDPLSNAETLMYQTLLNFPTLDELRRSLDETTIQTLPAVDKKVQNTQALIKSGLLSDCEFLDLSVIEHRLASVSESEGVKYSDDCTRYIADALKLYLLNLIDRLVDQKTLTRPGALIDSTTKYNFRRVDQHTTTDDQASLSTAASLQKQLGIIDLQLAQSCDRNFLDRSYQEQLLLIGPQHVSKNILRQSGLRIN